MEIIPVIDLKGGQVVHARAGQRAAYQPIRSPLSPTSAPADVTAGLLRLAAFRRLYVADLDAIMRQGDHDAALAALAAGRPEVEFWVDNGAGDAAKARGWLGRGIGCLVIGSESQGSAGLIRTVADDPRVVLSLDFRGELFQGPPDILADPACWPARVIVMTLSRVGAGGGPDLDRLRTVIDRAQGRAVYAAGGVRHGADLTALAKAGAAGVLVATALHGGAITAADLQAVARPDGRATLHG